MYRFLLNRLFGCHTCNAHYACGTESLFKSRYWSLIVIAAWLDLNVQNSLKQTFRMRIMYAYVTRLTRLGHKQLWFWDVFWGFSANYCVRKSKASYFQLSTLIWLVGPSLVTLPHHARSPLWCSCLPGSRSCPGLDLARGRVWCLKSQWMQ